MFIIDHHCLSPYHMSHIFGDLFDCWKNRRKTVEQNMSFPPLRLLFSFNESWNCGAFQPAQTAWDLVSCLSLCQCSFFGHLDPKRQNLRPRAFESIAMEWNWCVYIYTHIISYIIYHISYIILVIYYIMYKAPSLS